MNAHDETGSNRQRWDGTKIAAAGVATCVTGLILGVIVPHPVFALPVAIGVCVLLVGVIVRWRERAASKDKS